ncbi:hypothetical protein CTI14_13540, partial [Methylobacterium radiotolerans]
GAEFHRRDVTTITPEEISGLYPPDAVKVLVGCAPCQPYSSAAAKTKIGKQQSELEGEWKPLRAFLDLILAVQPDVVSMENVVRLATPGKFPVYADFKSRLTEAGIHSRGAPRVWARLRNSPGATPPGSLRLSQRCRPVARPEVHQGCLSNDKRRPEGT